MMKDENLTMETKRWHIHEGFYIDEIDPAGRVVALCDPASGDDDMIPFADDMIDDIIEALKQVKAHYTKQDAEQVDKERLARWGNSKILCVEEENFFPDDD